MIMKKLLRNTGILVLALVLSLAFGSIAFASAASYSYKLPDFQGNVTIASGTKGSIGSAYAQTKPSYITTGNAYQWLDDSAGRASDSKLTYTNSPSYLYYYNTTARGSIALRACTNGWQSGTVIQGYVNFG